MRFIKAQNLANKESRYTERKEDGSLRRASATRPLASVEHWHIRKRVLRFETGQRERLTLF